MHTLRCSYDSYYTFSSHIFMNIVMLPSLFSLSLIYIYIYTHTHTQSILIPFCIQLSIPYFREYYEKLPLRAEENLLWTIGELVIAKAPADEQWYRARISEVSDSSNLIKVRWSTTKHLFFTRMFYLANLCIMCLWIFLLF